MGVSHNQMSLAHTDLVDGYLSLLLKSNFAVSRHMRCLAVGMSTDIRHRVLSRTEKFYQL